MNNTIAAFLRSSPPSMETGAETTVSLIRDKIRGITDPFWQWPDVDQETIELHYAVYMESIAGGKQQPFPSLPPRFYFVFRLGWPSDPTVWIYYHPSKLSDGSIVGDSLFPTLAAKTFEVGSIIGPRVFETAVPGELAVAFAPDVSSADAAQILAAASPNFRIVDVVSAPGNLYLTSCRPFAEIEDSKIIEAIPGVRYAEPNRHVSLISPGGYWKLSKLL